MALARDRKIEEITFGYFDLETTGLSPRFGDRVCEVGFVEAKPGRKGKHFCTFVNPTIPISSGASLVNGITDEMLAGAPLFSEIAKEVCAILSGVDVIVIHNAPFDLGFLDSELSRRGLSLPARPVIDTLFFARRYFSFSSNSLGNIARFLRIDMSGAHRALADAQITRKIFETFLARLKIKTLNELLALQGEIILAEAARDGQS